MTKNTENKYEKTLIYISSAIAYFAIMVSAITYGKASIGADRIVAMMNMIVSVCFIVYLVMNEYKLGFELKIYDSKGLYMIFSLILILVFGFYHPMNVGFGENVAANVWLAIGSLAAAVAGEMVFRALGDFCFPEKKISSEIIMIVFGAAFYLYQCVFGMEQGLTCFFVSIGISTMMTGVYLRYHKICANVGITFVIYYFTGVTGINSTIDATVFGDRAPLVIAGATIAMVIFGYTLIRAYNRNGIFDDTEDVKSQDEQNAKFRDAFMQNKQKYEEKVSEKAAPTIEARKEKHFEKKQERQEKKKAKKQ